MQQEHILAWLMQDEISHIDMLAVLRRGTADVLYAGEDGVILYERESRTCMISMLDMKRCRKLLDIKQYDMFAVHQQAAADWIAANGNFTQRFACYQAVYSKNEAFAEDFTAIHLVTPQYADDIHRQYKGVDDIEYIHLLIQKQQLWGLFIQDELVAFIGEHLEGSMGLLEVFPAYRHKGYGQKLEKFLINHYLAQGKTPFCQVKADNEPSLALQKKLGLTLSSQMTTWIF